MTDFVVDFYFLFLLFPVNQRHFQDTCLFDDVYMHTTRSMRVVYLYRRLMSKMDRLRSLSPMGTVELSAHDINDCPHWKAKTSTNDNQPASDLTGQPKVHCGLEKLSPTWEIIAVFEVDNE